MQTELLKLLRRPLKREIKLNKKVFVFFICFLLSFFLWFQINLSKQHTDSLPLVVEFTGLPKYKFVTAVIRDTLYAEVEANGFALLNYDELKANFEFKKLKRDKKSDDYYFLPNTHLKTFSKLFGDDFKVLKIIPDTVFVETR